MMGYERNDRRYDRDYRGGGYSAGRDYAGRDYARDDERGFFDRAGDEVRSWFGDEEAERRRRMDERYDERSDRDRFVSRDYGMGGYSRPDRYPSWARSNRDERFYGGGGAASQGWPGPRYDRVERGGQSDGGGYARDAYGYGRSGYGNEPGSDYRTAYREPSGYGAGRYGYERGSQPGGSGDDQHGYRDWRDRQVSALDRDYDEYRHENRQRFASEFATWRANRQTQRDSLSSVKEHQEVVGSDGGHVGKVDHVRSDHILLTKTDRDAGGHHHSIPSSWIATVADKVTLNKTADEAKRLWRDAEERGGLFGGSRDETDVSHSGRHNLDRSFSGTY